MGIGEAKTVGLHTQTGELDHFSHPAMSVRRHAGKVSWPQPPAVFERTQDQRQLRPLTRWNKEARPIDVIDPAGQRIW